MNRRYQNWSKTKRLEQAALRVEDEGWTQGKAAEEYGVSRQRVNVYVRKLREKRAQEETYYAERVLDQAKRPEGLNEQRRVGSFQEFDDYYFSRWICPDCEKHHDRPPFHDEMVSVAEDESIKRVLINVPPYHAKSTILTVKHTVYRLIKDPNSRRIIVSKSLPFARTFLHSIDQLLTNPDLYEGGPSLIDDWGPFKTDSRTQIWNKEQIYVAGRSNAEKDPTVQVLGVGGQIYGRRADDIIFDDIADDLNQANPDQVEKMRNWIDKMALSRIGRNGRAIFVGTRVGAGDIYSILQTRAGYKVIRYSCILEEWTDEDGNPQGITLWPDHFGYLDAVNRREEMTDADWQLVYQNVDMPGLGASFTEEMMDASKDLERTVGHYDPHWRLVVGLDLAGGTKDSGFTAGVLKGVDLATGRRFYVDVFNEKSMKAPRLKDMLFQWADNYPLHELRVESNGLQSQIIQYDDELVKAFALRGIRVVPHITTGHNKWDPEFGVEATAPLFSAGLEDIPWGNEPTRRKFQPMIDQYLQFPMGARSDIVMADWIAELGIRELLKRAHLPLFDERMKVPNRIKRRRMIVDFGSRSVRRVHPSEQGVRFSHERNVSPLRRRTIGRPVPHDHEDPEPSEPRRFVNVDRYVEETA